VLLTTGWLATLLLLVYVAGVPPWLAFIGNLVGAVVIYNYARSFADEPLSRGERALRKSLYVILGAVALFMVLVLVVTTLAFIVTLISN
jgi:hypothetical protein